jgi:hypothetical protein
VGLIQIAQPWDRQPDGIVRPNPELPAPALLWHGAAPEYNAATGGLALSAYAGTGLSYEASRYGKELAFSGSGTHRHVFATPSEANQVTFVIQARVTGSPSNLDRLFSNYNGAGSGRYDIYFGGAGPWTFQIFRATANTQFLLTSLTTFSGTLVITYVFGQTPKVWLNGAPRSVTAYFPGSGAQVTASKLTAIASRPDSTGVQADAAVSAFARYDVALPDSMAQAISSPGDVWGLFEPRRIWIPTASAGGGLPTLTWRDPIITATGTTPRVDYAY